MPDRVCACCVRARMCGAKPLRSATACRHWCSAGNLVPCPGARAPAAPQPPASLKQLSTPQVALAVAANTYNNQTDKIDQGACTACPENAVSLEASTSIRDCTCKPAYFDRAPAADQVECVLCPVGSDCMAEGTDLATLPLLPGYYRVSNASDDLRRCPDFGGTSGCVGGIAAHGEGPCRELLTGPYCRLCYVSDTSRYYDPVKSRCLLCEGSVFEPMALAGGVAVGLVLLGLLWARFKPHRKARVLRKAADRLWRLCIQLSLRAKVKQTVLQSVIRTGSGHRAPTAAAVQHTLPENCTAAKEGPFNHRYPSIKWPHTFRVSTTSRCQTRWRSCSQSSSCSIST